MLLTLHARVCVGPDFVTYVIVPFLGKRELIDILYLYSLIYVGVYVL